MAEADRTPRDRRTGLPDGLLDALTTTSERGIRPDEVARGRRRAAARAYDHGDVVEEIACRLLSLSTSRSSG